jgi:7,8-dihydropterin-6-yl-methyl-4-(beta-D-ribofuranosyl)aminobenzene 5'-phosphate synthase
MAKTHITVVVENTAHGPMLLAEHGLAYWIEYDGRHVLLDSGQGGVLAGNAYKLKIPLYDLDALILSHGHYDHTGGVAEALKTNRPVMVYANTAAFTRKYVRKNDGTARDIGIPYLSSKAIRDSRNRLISTEKPTSAFDRLTVTGPVPRLTDFEDTGGPFFLDEDCTKPDPLEDDQSVFFDTAEGVVVLLGCAHSGVINTLRYVVELSGGKPVHTVIGGMHLVQAAPERIARTIEELGKMNVQRLIPGHCTGMAAMAAMWNAFPGRCATCHVGSKFEFECI